MFLIKSGVDFAIKNLLSGPIFKEEGIKKLCELSTELSELLNKKYQDDNVSDYSKRMIINTIDIIDELTKNNDVGYWLSTNGRNKLEEFNALIDGKTDLHVPVIFNQQSLDFTDLLAGFLRKLDLNADVHLTMLTKTIAPNMKSHIDYKINIAEFFKSIYEGTLHYQKNPTGGFKRSIDSLTNSIYQCQDAEQLNEQIVQFNTKLEELKKLLERNDIPYLINFFDGYGEKVFPNSMPYTLDKNSNPKKFSQLATQFNRFRVIAPCCEAMLDCETVLNTKILLFNQEAEKSTKAFELIKTKVDVGNACTKKQQIDDCLKKHLDKFKQYIGNVKKSGLSKTDPKKVELINSIITHFEKESSEGVNLSLGNLTYQLFLTICEHEQLLATNPSLSSGQCGEILGNAYKELNKLWHDLDLNNDHGMIDRMNKYAEKNNVEKLEVNVSNNNNSMCK